MVEAMSETQVKVGTITSPGPLASFSADSVTRFADAPELTKTLCFSPSHADHSRSNACTWLDWVSTGTVLRNSITDSRSATGILLLISGQSSATCPDDDPIISESAASTTAVDWLSIRMAP